MSVTHSVTEGSPSGREFQDSERAWCPSEPGQTPDEDVTGILPQNRTEDGRRHNLQTQVSSLIHHVIWNVVEDIVGSTLEEVPHIERWASK